MARPQWTSLLAFCWCSHLLLVATQTCSHDSECAASQKAFSQAPTLIQKQLKIVPGEENPLKIVYSIGAGKTSSESLEACLKTWGSRLGRGELQVIGIDSKLADYGDPMSLTRINFDLAPECPDNHDGGACKDAVGLVNGLKAGADWVVLLGTDNYIVPSNVREALKAYDPAEPMILGIQGCGSDMCQGGGLCGGGGQIASRGALLQMIRNGRDAFLKEQQEEATACGGWGDVADCRVAYNHNVSVQSLDGLHGWKTEEQHYAEMLKTGLTFHYVKPSEMYKMHEVRKQLSDLSLLQQGAVQKASQQRRYLEARDRYVREENERRKQLILQKQH
eukprot:TRINITY_DN50175_c0_g1_i1.p1 TRINITY_DN50175_c0_g1~~TRINITY_DN50175_c0_g1_i1.p1  ORF type:complete len:356 (-),score=57.82 TRINITY_DN50175_c0_g1_i1:50-1051(-)